MGRAPGNGDSNLKGAGMLVGNFETTRGGAELRVPITKVDITLLNVNFA